MRLCPRCGAACPEPAATCPACGLAVALPAAPELGQTVLTSPTPPTTPGPGPSPAPDRSHNFAQTMLGHAAPDAAPGPPAPSAGPKQPERPPANLKGTMIGLAPLPARGTAPAPSSTSAPAGAAALKGTMIGIAPLAPGSTDSAPPVPPEPAKPLTPEPQRGPHGTQGFGGTIPSGGVANLAGSKKTVMGVARPGIAPLRPGVAKADAPEPPPPVEPLWSPPMGAASPETAPESTPIPPGPKRVPVLAAAAIVGAAALLAAAGVGLFVYRTRGEIEAKVALNDAGSEELVLRCPGCEPGAVVRLGSAKAAFNDGLARLKLESQLAIGDNALALELERRPGKSETVELTVPVEYRVRGDTSGLSETPPVLRVRADAVAGTTVLLDNKPVPLLTGAGALLPIEVSEALSGESAGVQTLERRVPYSITPPDSQTQTGEVVVRIGIAPLVVLAPGASLVIDTPTFVLAGRTAKNGAVSVEGRPITVDAAGNFAQVMGVSSAGETVVSVRATLPDHAPRLVPIKIRRVESLAQEAARRRTSAESSHAALVRDMGTKPGGDVALEGSVLEARAETYTTVLLLDMKTGCQEPPCLVRVSLGAKSALAAGDAVNVFGKLSGAVDGPRAGSKIPAVSAEFLVKGRL